MIVPYRLAIVLVALVALFFAIAAQAKWKPEYGDNSPEIQKWFREQHNANGQWCCDESDGHRFDGDWSFDADGGVTVNDGGQVYKIEAYKVLKGANPTGGAVWWFTGDGTARRTYCFAPGSLT